MDSREAFDSPVILVACHEEPMRRLLEKALAADGYEVLLARNSREALLVGLEYPQSIDALITHIELGAYQNGMELAGCFHALRPETRILFTSTLKLPEASLPPEASVQGRISYLESPYSAARLLDCLENLMEGDTGLQTEAQLAGYAG